MLSVVVMDGWSHMEGVWLKPIGNQNYPFWPMIEQEVGKQIPLHLRQVSAYFAGLSPIYKVGYSNKTFIENDNLT